MAATSVCLVANTVFGDKAIRIYSVTVGVDTTLAFNTGMSTLLWHMWSAASATSNGNIECRKNEIADGTATSGYISVTGCTNGDDITVLVCGKH